MRLSNILTIFQKDMVDAIRDARVLMALVIPIGIGVVYSFMFDDETPVPEGTVAYHAVDSELPEMIENSTGETVRLTMEETATSDEVRQIVSDGDASIGLVIPEGFDQAVEAGESPELEILVPESPGFIATIVTASTDQALQTMSGIPAAAMIDQQVVSKSASGDPNVIDVLGLRNHFMIVALMMLAGMISMLAIPIILAEESEKKTMDALTMVASYGDVIAAKALVGLAYLTIGVLLALGISQIWPADPLLFFAGFMLIGVALMGFGLLLGGLFKSASQLNNWSGFFLIPVIGPAFAIGLWDPEGTSRILLEAMPVAQAMKITVNGMAGEALYSNLFVSVAIIAGWAVVAYGALGWHLSRREK